ncbi:MAG: DUF2726 domain-containing protein [Elusimicrobia bacterium]|nr:DUF2726 domain-containing protein [Elusimicrobiota bacterium]
MLLLLVIVLLSLVLVAVLKLKLKSGKFFPYTRSKYLFTQAERRFLESLDKAVSQDYKIFGKIRLADIIEPEKYLSRQRWRGYFNRISSKHIDFVICSKADLSLLCAIELDDSSHHHFDRECRDAFVDKALESAKVPLIRFPVKASYDVAEVKAKIEGILRPAVQPTAAPQHEPTNPPICPTCKIQMVLRTSSHGPNPGSKFWGCGNYPKCRHVETL